MSRHCTHPSFLVAGSVALLVAMTGGPALSDDPASTGDGMFTIQFEQVELPVFIKFIGKATGKNFVFSDKVGGTVTVVSPTPVTADQAFAVFQSVLAVRGLTMIDDGIVTRIVLLKEARTAGASVIDGDPSNSGFATRLFPLYHVNAAEVTGALESLVSKDGSLVAHPPTNTLIATDTVVNLRRMADVVKALDISSHEEAIEVIALEHADANTLAEQVEEILGKTAGRGAGKERAAQASGPPFKIVPDERTNSLVIVGSETDRRKIGQLARSLDKPLEPGEQRINVYYVKHADATQLVDVLSGMIGVARRRQAGAAPAGGGARTVATGSTGLSDDVSVTADPATNAVIINASVQDYRTIVGLLESLDIQRPQVFVEAIVAEVTLDRTEALGFEFQGGGDTGDGTAIARSSLGSLATAFVNPAALGGLVLAATSDKTIELPDGTEIPAQTALFNALAADQDIEVLSAPTLLTLDNQEARIVVGENVPFVTGQGVDLASVENVFTTIERRDVGIKLTITPQVSEGDMVVLDIEEEVSALVEQTLQPDIITSVGPAYTIRSAKTTVSVKDGRTAVIGGLISNSLATRVSKVPFLGDIPYLGRLFRSEAGRDEKVNLIVVLTPHIIRNDVDLARVSADEGQRYQDRLAEMPEFMGPRDMSEAIPGHESELEMPRERPARREGWDGIIRKEP